MKSWTKLLPFILVSWMARKYLQKHAHGLKPNKRGFYQYVEPYKGVRIYLKPHEERTV